MFLHVPSLLPYLNATESLILSPQRKHVVGNRQSNRETALYVNTHTHEAAVTAMLPLLVCAKGRAKLFLFHNSCSQILSLHLLVGVIGKTHCQSVSG